MRQTGIVRFVAIGTEVKHGFRERILIMTWQRTYMSSHLDNFGIDLPLWVPIRSIHAIVYVSSGSTSDKHLDTNQKTPNQFIASLTLPAYLDRCWANIEHVVSFTAQSISKTLLSQMLQHPNVPRVFSINAFPQSDCHKPRSSERAHAESQHMPSADVTWNSQQLLRNGFIRRCLRTTFKHERRRYQENCVRRFDNKKDKVEGSWSSRSDGVPAAYSETLTVCSWSWAGMCITKLTVHIASRFWTIEPHRLMQTY